MKLAEFYDRIAPFLLGEISHAEVVPALWGKEPPKIDAARLRIYGRFCFNHRAETLDGVFSGCRSAVVASLGERAWTQLIEDYFRAHPMHHFELNRNGEFFADYLGGEPRPPAAGSWPPFLAALADFEWWEWQASSTVNDPADAEPQEGPLRLASTVELRPYDWDFVTWMDDYEASDRPEAPEAEATVVLFWRDCKLRGRREPASQLEMLIIKAVLEQVPLDAELAERLQVDAEELVATVADLRSAGVILGALAPIEQE